MKCFTEHFVCWDCLTTQQELSQEVAACAISVAEQFAEVVHHLTGVAALTLQTHAERSTSKLRNHAAMTFFRVSAHAEECQN